METTFRTQQVKRITLLSFISNLSLGLIKMVAGFLTHSHGLVADGIHSLSDLLTDSLVFVAAHFGGQLADREHPYGHARIETVANVLIAIILFCASFGIIYDAWWHVSSTTLVTPHSQALLIVILSILINEWLFHATLRVAKTTHSELLKGNAWHHRSDAASSLVVLIGITGTLFGYIYLDVVAAVCVALMIAKMSFSLAYASFCELIDTAVDDKTLQQIQGIINHVSGVEEIHQLRTRLMAGKILVDVHVLVDSHLTVSEGHHISQQVHQALCQKMPMISDVIVHIDPEDDETVAPSLDLPSRQQLLPLLESVWKNLPGYDQIKNIRFHYLDGLVHIDVYFSVDLIKQVMHIDEIITNYQQALRSNQYPWVVKVYYC